MIQFTLKCEEDHRFDSWFRSAEAFDKLQSAGMVTCAVCGSTQVEKSLMAPRVRDSKSKAVQSPDVAKQALAHLKKEVEKNAEYVGGNFAQEARDIHEGIAPERSIYGEVKPDDARKLVEDGVKVAPLPFIPGRKSN